MSCSNTPVLYNNTRKMSLSPNCWASLHWLPSFPLPLIHPVSTYLRFLCPPHHHHTQALSLSPSALQVLVDVWIIYRRGQKRSTRSVSGENSPLSSFFTPDINKLLYSCLVCIIVVPLKLFYNGEDFYPGVVYSYDSFLLWMLYWLNNYCLLYWYLYFLYGLHWGIGKGVM